MSAHDSKVLDEPKETMDYETQRHVNLSHNSEGEIQNPLRDVPRHVLLEDVARFQRDKGLPVDILPLLQKGALVARDPAGFESLEDLDADDKRTLREEVTHRWKHPWALYYTIFLNSIAAAIQGWDQASRLCSAPGARARLANASPSV